MEIQYNTSQIPINTRTVGTPGGIYILYLEDYVHTFIKKLLPQQAEITLLGKRYEEDGRSVLVVSGATQQAFSEEEPYSRKYFPGCDFLGTAKIGLNKDGGLRLELGLRNTSVVLDDFYIYYDQNEEMQNYLVEWNLNHKDRRPCEEENEPQPVRRAERGYQTRAETDDAVRLGRIAQAYNREEAKVSFMWNVMNVLCLGFVMCVMVYGIISVNNYHKMQDMQETIDYCVAFIEQNMHWGVREDTAVPTSAPVSVNGGQQSGIQSTPGASPDTAAQEGSAQQNAVQDMGAAQQDTASAVQSTETVQQNTASAVQSTEAAQQNTTSTVQSTETAQQNTASDVQSTETVQQDSTPNTENALQSTQTAAQQESTASIPQYYVVERGDTLRSISYAVYGNYSMVDEICEWNKIENPDSILCGQRLLLP